MADEIDEPEVDVCDRCCGRFLTSELNYGPDPYSEEIKDDDTPCVLCDECLEDSKHAI